MNRIFISRTLSVSLALAGLSSLASEAQKPSNPGAAKQKRPTTHSRAAVATSQSLTPPALALQNPRRQPDFTLNALHKKRLEAIRKAKLAHAHKPKHKVKEWEEDEAHESKNPRGIPGGEYFMWQVRSYPNGSIDPTAFDRAIAQRSRMRTGSIGSAGSTRHGIGTQALFPSATWSFVGPINWYPTTQRTYYGIESINGHLEGIVADFTNRLILYIASATGGVFKTTDGGITWKALSNNWPYLQTNTLAMDPKNRLIVYAGTGNAPTGSGNAIGLMKTTDGGLHWSNIGADKDGNGNPLYFAGTNVTKIMVDPTNSNLVTVLTTANGFGSNIWNSTDGGTTWTKKVEGFPSGGGFYDANWVDGVATKSGTYLAVGSSFTSTSRFLLYRSLDGGRNWGQLPNAPVAPSASPGATGARLCVSPVNPNTVYLAYAYSDHITLFKTVNNGSTWTDISADSGLTSGFPTSEQLNQVWYDYYLACSSRKINNVATDVLYLGLKNAYQQVQTEGNNTWVNFGNSDGNNASIHYDQHSIAFDPTNPNRGWLCNDGGIYGFYSNPNTNVNTFQSLNNGLQIAQFYNTAYHPTDPTIMLGGSQDNGTGASLGDLNSWQMPTGGDAFSVLINPQNPQTMYSTYVYGSTSRTDDMYVSGRYDITPNTSSNGVGGVAFVTPLAMDPTNPNFVYTAGKKLGRYDATKPRATAWTYFPTVLTTSEATTLAVSPVDGRRIYVATRDGKLMMTANGGSTWVTLKAGNANDTLPNTNVGGILPDPANAKAVYVGLSGVNVPGHLYYCPDVTVATPTWTNLSGEDATALPDTPLNTIAIDPADANILYVGTDIGVFQSADRGQTWSNATAPLGLPNVLVTDLKAMPLQGFLYAGTFGRGIFRIRIRNNDPVAGLLFSPERINGGMTMAGTVLLGTDSPVGGTTVTLTSDKPASADVPATVTVPQGQNQATFTVTTSPVGFTTPVKITASLPGTGAGFSKTATVTVLAGLSLPYFQSLAYVNYNGSLFLGIGGTLDTPAVITLSKAATSAITVTLTSSSGGAIVPASVVIPAGQKSVRFTVGLRPVNAPEITKITAQLGGFKKVITATRN